MSPVIQGWLKRSEDHLDTTSVSSISVHLALNRDHSWLTGVCMSNSSRKWLEKNAIAFLIASVSERSIDLALNWSSVPCLE